MQLFYSPNIDSLFTLDAEESRHAVRVMRLRRGDAMYVTDGCGTLCCCRIVDADERACAVEVVEKMDSPAEAPGLTLAVAPTKNPARMEWLVEKAVEVGVGEVQLLQCDHSERVFLKTERLQRVALSAMKQSLHTVLPPVRPAVSFRQWIATVDTPLRLIAHCEADQPRTPLAQMLQPGYDATVLIGPEGDFSPEEIELALDSGFHPVSLGPSRLRTETAALYAVVAFSQANS